MTISPDHPSGSVVDTHDAYFNLTASLDEEEMRNFISFNRCTVSTYKVSNRLSGVFKEARDDLKDTTFTRIYTEIIDPDDNKLRPSY